MINGFKIRRYGAFVLTGFIPAITLLLVFNFKGVMWAITGCMLMVVIMTFLGGFMTSHPFQKMVEGSGLLIINLDSTGVIRPFIAQIEQPFIKGKIGKEEMNDVYDREAVYMLSEPTFAGKVTVDDKSRLLKLEITEADYNKARFGMFNYPVMIWNGQIKSLITKDYLSEQEKLSFAEHGILYLNRKMEELTSAMRDFGRYIVESLKPKTDFLKSWWFWLIIAVGVGIIALMFGKPVIQAIMGGVESATPTVSQALASGTAVIPR